MSITLDFASVFDCTESYFLSTKCSSKLVPPILSSSLCQGLKFQECRKNNTKSYCFERLWILLSAECWSRHEVLEILNVPADCSSCTEGICWTLRDCQVRGVSCQARGKVHSTECLRHFWRRGRLVTVNSSLHTLLQMFGRRIMLFKDRFVHARTRLKLAALNYPLPYASYEHAHLFDWTILYAQSEWESVYAHDFSAGVANSASECGVTFVLEWLQNR